MLGTDRQWLFEVVRVLNRRISVPCRVVILKSTTAMDDTLPELNGLARDVQ